MYVLAHVNNVDCLTNVEFYAFTTVRVLCRTGVNSVNILNERWGATMRLCSYHSTETDRQTDRQTEVWTMYIRASSSSTADDAAVIVSVCTQTRSHLCISVILLAAIAVHHVTPRVTINKTVIKSKAATTHNVCIQLHSSIPGFVHVTLTLTR